MSLAIMDSMSESEIDEMDDGYEEDPEEEDDDEE